MNIYTTDPELVAAGCRPITVGTDWFVFDIAGDGYDTSHVSTEAIERAASVYESSRGPILLDLEMFHASVNFDHATSNLKLALRHWHAVRPEVQLGLYGHVPQCDFWSPVKRVEYLQKWNRSEWVKADAACRAWEELNTRIGLALADAADFICPSIYALDPRYVARWPLYADANLCEAQRAGRRKPVWPILQVVYPDGKQIPLATWRTMLELCGSHPSVDAVIVFWAANHAPVDGWRGVVAEHTTT